MIRNIFIYFILFSIILLPACKPAGSGQANHDQTDTVLIKFSHFYGESISDSDQIDLTMIRSVRGDSIFFEYINYYDTSYNFTLGIQYKNGVIGYPNNNFIKNDYTETDFHGKQIHISKFDLLNPDIDGNLFTLLSNEMGLIGDSYYAWGNGIILTEYNGVKADTAFIHSMLAPSTGFFMKKPQ